MMPFRNSSNKQSKKKTDRKTSDRREFLGLCGSYVLGVGALALLPVLNSCAPGSIPVIEEEPDAGPGTGGQPPTQSDGSTPVNVAKLTADGMAMVATGIKGPDGKGIIISRISASEFKALSMECTHMGCLVESAIPRNGPIPCACHGSQFNLDGTVKRGPASSPLRSYPATYDASQKVVKLMLA